MTSTTPRAVAQRIVSLLPDAVLVDLPTAGHSAIDTRERTALDVVKAVYAGTLDELPSRSAQLDAEPGGIGVRMLVWAIAAAAVAESVVPVGGSAGGPLRHYFMKPIVV